MMLENLDGDVLKLRSGHASNDFLAKLNKLRSDNLFLDIDLILSKQPECIPAEDEQGNVRDPMKETTTLKEDPLKAHKIVLSCCSPYFEKMFGENFSEKNQRSVCIGCDLDYSAFEQILNFFYTGVLEITPLNAIELLQVADVLLLDQTKECLLKYMQQTLNSENCILYKDVGKTFACTTLAETADRFARRNFEDVCKR